MSVSLVQQAIRTIHEIQYVTVATLGSDYRPWNTPVYAAFDDDYRFFWISDSERQHSRNIRRNAAVFLVVFDSTIPAGTGARQGVYIQAHAYELSDPEQVSRGLSLVTGRAGGSGRETRDYLRDDRPGRIYQATPERIWVNDNAERLGARIDARVEIGLDALRAERRPT